jgi:hypothetical protein
VTARTSRPCADTSTSSTYTFRDGNVMRIQLFTKREPALEAAGLTRDYQEEKR